MGRLHGVRASALRFANVYGPRQSPKGEAGVVAIFCRRHQAKKTLTVFGDGQATRDYLYVGDVVDAICCLLESPQADQVYNLGTGVETSVLDLIRELEGVSGRSAEVDYVSARQGEVAHSALDAKTALRTFDWRAQTGLAKGLTITYSELNR